MQKAARIPAAPRRPRAIRTATAGGLHGEAGYAPPPLSRRQRPRGARPAPAFTGILLAAGREFGYASRKNQGTEKIMAFYVFYVIAIVVLILHFTGWLKRNNLEWLVLVLAASVFPVVIFLR
jgi:hypothetical protein